MLFQIIILLFLEGIKPREGFFPLFVHHHFVDAIPSVVFRLKVTVDRVDIMIFWEKLLDELHHGGVSVDRFDQRLKLGLEVRSHGSVSLQKGEGLSEISILKTDHK